MHVFYKKMSKIALGTLLIGACASGVMDTTNAIKIPRNLDRYMRGWGPSPHMSSQLLTNALARAVRAASTTRKTYIVEPYKELNAGKALEFFATAEGQDICRTLEESRAAMHPGVREVSEAPFKKYAFVAALSNFQYAYDWFLPEISKLKNSFVYDKGLEPVDDIPKCSDIATQRYIIAQLALDKAKRLRVEADLAMRTYKIGIGNRLALEYNATAKATEFAEAVDELDRCAQDYAAAKGLIAFMKYYDKSINQKYGLIEQPSDPAK